MTSPRYQIQVKTVAAHDSALVFLLGLFLIVYSRIVKIYAPESPFYSQRGRLYDTPRCFVFTRRNRFTL